MAKNESYTQVAFVVDVSTCRKPGESWKEAICLCIFRVLCFLNNRHQSIRRRGEEKRKHLKWGCKLFDIDGLNGAVRSFSSNFKDFKRKTFDDFERDFMSVFVAPSTSSSVNVNISLSSDWQNKCIGNGLVLETHSHHSGAGSKKRSELSSFPAKALSKCLTETLHDFPWEVLEIGSPIKKSQKQTVDDQDDKMNKRNLNLVFLISRVPCDKKTMRYYCNKVVIDKDVFLGSFMPELLHQELLKKRNIKIYWVDTGRYFQPNITGMIPPPDQSCLDIVERCVRSMGGVLLPFHIFVTSLSGKRHFCNLSREASVDRSRDLEIPSFKKRDKDAVLLATFSFMSACYGQIPKARLLTQAKPEVQHQVTLVLDSSQGDCCCQEFTLKLVPINIPPAECPQSCGKQSIQSLKGSPYRVGSPLRQTRQSTYHHRCQSLTRLEARATISKVRLRSLHLGLHASALCYVTSGASADQRKAFSSMLGSLHLCQQALVMSAWVRSVSCVALSVLEAASPHSGYLSHLSVDMSLQVEKVLRPWSPLASDRTNSEAFLKFKDRAVNAVLENHRQRPLSLTEQAGQAQNNIGSRMWVNCINPWHVSSNTGSLKYLMDKLAIQADEMQFLSENEKNTLLDMRHAVWVDPLFQQLQFTPGLSPASAGSPFACPRVGSDPGISRESLSGSGSDSRCGLPSTLSRGQLMVNKSRLVASQGLPQDEVDGDSIHPVITATTLSPDYISNLDLKSESEVGQYLQEQYDGVLDKGLSLETAVRTILTVTQHFIALKDTPSPQDSTVEFMRQRLLKSCRELKMFYQNAASEEDGKAKIIEFKLQILLRMEMESIVSGMDASKHDEAVEEVVQYLRSLLFVTGAGEVPEFLTNVLLARYLTALPQMLVTIYEELQQPLPLELAAFDTSLASVAPSAFGPLSTSSRASFPPSSDFSLNPDSNQSSASQKAKTRNTICSHPVLTKQGPKRQIVVPKHVVKKSSRNGLKKKTKVKTARKSPGKPLKQIGTGNISKAKRDLFNAKTAVSGAEKSVSTPKKQTPRKKASSSGKRDRTFVVETPNHKQRSRLAYRREQVVKHYSKKGYHAVQIVAESPEKEIVDIQKSLLVKRPARHVLRQAFYSGKPEHDSRNLKRATESAGSMSLDHSQHHRVLRAQSAGRLSEALSETEKEEKKQSVLTPRRQHIRASFIKQLTQITSPEIASLPDQRGSVTPRRRSRTPLTGSRTPMRTPRQKLDCEMEGQSLPAWTTSVRARLNFTSPDKIGALPASESVSLPSTSPRPVTRSVTSASKMAVLHTPPSSKLKVVSRLDFSSAVNPACMLLSLATSGSSKTKTPTKTEPNVQKGIRVKLPPRKKNYSKSVSDLKSTPQQQINTAHLSPAKQSASHSPAKLSASCFAKQSTLRSPARHLTSHSPSRYLNDRRASTVTTAGSKLQSNCFPRSLENEFGCIDKVLDYPLCEDSVPGTPPRNSHQSGLYGSARNNGKPTAATKSRSQLAAAQSSSVLNPSQPMYVKDKEAATPVKTRSQISALKSPAPINICFMESTGSSEQTATSQKKSDMFTKQSPVKTCSLNKLTDTNSSLATETNRTSLFNKLVTTSTRRESRVRLKPGSHEMKGVSPSHSSSSSNSQQSSILDYVSPVHKVNTAASDASLSVTPTRRGNTSLLSSTKSPKSILKNSPHSSRSTTPFKVSCGTPHKVMFESNAQQKRLFATSPSTDCLMGSQVAISKWPRKKRRNSNGSKSPQSDATPEKSPRKMTHSTDPSPARKLLETKVSVRAIRTENMPEMIAISDSDRVGISPHKCRKRSLPQSEQTGTSSAKKRRKTDSSAAFSIDRPVSFSENAMDGSDFSPSRTINTVAFGESNESDEDIFTTPVKQSSKIFKLANSRSSHFSSRSPSFFPEGSQGFEVGTSNASSFCTGSSSLPSATFSSSPLLVSRAKTRKGVGAHFPTGVTDSRQLLHDQICQNSEKAVPESKGKRIVSIEAGVDKGSKLLTPPQSQSTLDNSLTKRSARGTPKNLKFSPSVTTKSLVHLLNSPLLVNPTDIKRRITDESEISQIEQNSKRKKMK